MSNRLTGDTKRIFWLTSDFFLDVDIPIISQLQADFEIDWHIIYSSKVLNDYSNSDFKAKIHSTNVRIVETRNKYRFRDIRNALNLLLLCFKIRKEQYDLIYFDDHGFPYLFFFALILLDKRRLIYAAHDVEVHSGFKDARIIQAYLNFIFARCRNFHLFSNTQRRAFDRKFPNKQVFVAPLCLKDYGDALPQKENDGDVVTFLFFGALRPNKGVNLLIEAGNILAADNPGRFKIIIAGKCDDWSQYQSLMRFPEIFDIRLGVVPNKEIPELFAEASYLVLPYLDVTQSGPLFVAFNYCVPVIASDLPGFNEFISPENDGVLFNVGSAQNLSEKMLDLIRSGKNCHERMRGVIKDQSSLKFKPEYVKSLYAEAFLKICKNAGPNRTNSEKVSE